MRGVRVSCVNLSRVFVRSAGRSFHDTTQRDATRQDMTRHHDMTGQDRGTHKLREAGPATAPRRFSLYFSRPFPFSSSFPFPFSFSFPFPFPPNGPGRVPCKVPKGSKSSNVILGVSFCSHFGVSKTSIQIFLSCLRCSEAGQVVGEPWRHWLPCDFLTSLGSCKRRLFPNSATFSCRFIA